MGERALEIDVHSTSLQQSGLYIQNYQSSEQQCERKGFGHARVWWVKALRAAIILLSLAVNHCGLQTLRNVSQGWHINQSRGLTGASWETIKQDWHLKCGHKWVRRAETYCKLCSLYKLLSTVLNFFLVFRLDFDSSHLFTFTSIAATTHDHDNSVTCTGEPVLFHVAQPQETCCTAT